MKLEGSLEMKVINIIKRKLEASLQSSNTKMAVHASLFETLTLNRVFTCFCDDRDLIYSKLLHDKINNCNKYLIT